uniref:Uncharacterized protein n=1 Tax=Ditylum brightwellii TaxID=49249 RepID=A0A7S4SV12_9STRA|mmetsp:Transcript_24375/g.36353  ORF Transcript_24375/g.36353 Transcript_24375/m.36353 type:complete len:153 (+) Transcript_24375:59-517(+)
MIRRRDRCSSMTRRKLLDDSSYDSDGEDLFGNFDNLFGNSNGKDGSEDGASDIDVDLCLTIMNVGASPPTLPLKGEHVTLGVEAIHKSKGLGDLAVFQESIRKSMVRARSLSSASGKTKSTASDAFSTQSMNPTAISYDEYSRHSTSNNFFA